MTKPINKIKQIIKKDNLYFTYIDGNFVKSDNNGYIIDLDTNSRYYNTIVYYKNVTLYYVNGKLHREDGPAYENRLENITQYWINGKLHREDGPAEIKNMKTFDIEYSNLKQIYSYYINGICIYNTIYDSIKNKEYLPYYSYDDKRLQMEKENFVKKLKEYKLRAFA